MTGLFFCHSQLTSVRFSYPLCSMEPVKTSQAIPVNFSSGQSPKPLSNDHTPPQGGGYQHPPNHSAKIEQMPRGVPKWKAQITFADGEVMQVELGAPHLCLCVIKLNSLALEHPKQAVGMMVVLDDSRIVRP